MLTSQSKTKFKVKQKYNQFPFSEISAKYNEATESNRYHLCFSSECEGDKTIQQQPTHHCQLLLSKSDAQGGLQQNYSQ